ncbi:MAG: helix-turn-helix transcriptional regulator [Nitrospiraceae bacterium]
MRRREVLLLVAEGHGTREIARVLSMPVKTVEFHKARIMPASGSSHHGRSHPIPDHSRHHRPLAW